jgi:hypothetical protein
MGKGKRADVYLEVRKRRGHIFFEWNKKYMPSPQYFSIICDPFANPIISLHSRDISLFDCHI